MKCEYKVHTEHCDTLDSDIFNIVFAVAFVAFVAFIAAVVAHVNVSKMFSFVSNKTRQQTVRNVSRPSPLHSPSSLSVYWPVLTAVKSNSNCNYVVKA